MCSWNEDTRLQERRRPFNVEGLIRLAAEAVNRNVDNVVGFSKLAEGGFNRTFLLTMKDNFQMVARLPYPVSQPKPLLISSEVATMDYLRIQGIPVPKVYGYCPTAENLAATEYIFMEFVRGTNLGDIWFEIGEKARLTIVEKLVDLESRLFSLELPASGSLYYSRDLDIQSGRIDVQPTSSIPTQRFCIGPDTTLALWYGKRIDLDVHRGPCEQLLTSDRS